MSRQYRTHVSITRSEIHDSQMSTPSTLAHVYVAGAASLTQRPNKHVERMFMHIMFPRRYDSTSRRGAIAHFRNLANFHMSRCSDAVRAPIRVIFSRYVFVFIYIIHTKFRVEKHRDGAEL